MKFYRQGLLVVLLAAIFLGILMVGVSRVVAAPPAQTHPDGSTLTRNQTSSGTWGPGIVSATTDIVIQSGVIITIAPGTTIRIATSDGNNAGVDNSRIEFIVQSGGELRANGPVTFTSQAVPAPANWYGIRYEAGSRGWLTNVTLEYGVHALTLSTANPVTVTNSRLRYSLHQNAGNNKDVFGAGLVVVTGSPLITGTQIYSNTASTTQTGAEAYGAGVDIQGGAPQLVNCQVYLNSASSTRSYGGGGGIAIRGTGTAALIQGSRVTTNTLDIRSTSNNYPGAGAGIGVYDATQADIRYNLVADNVNVSYYAAGGGIGFQTDATANLIEGNLILNNQAAGTSYGEGGGIDAWLNNDFLAANNLIYNNSARTEGGGIFLNGNARYFHNTIVSNTAQLGGGASRQESGYIYNNIIVGNRATQNHGGVYRWLGSAGYNDVWNNIPNNYDDPASIPPTDWQVDPWFVGTGSLTEQFHLRSSSPLVDVGAAVVTGTTLPTTDYDGDPRPQYFGRDLGFDEVVLDSTAPLVFVQRSSPFLGVGEGLSYTVLILNNTAVTSTWQMTDELPLNTTYRSGPVCNLPACTYDSQLNAVVWSGSVPPGGLLQLYYGVSVNVGLPDATAITNTATLRVGTGLTTTNVVTTLIDNPVFALDKTVTGGTLIAGAPFDYRIDVRNTSLTGRATNIVLTDTLPAGMQLVTASSGGQLVNGDTVRWTVPAVVAGGIEAVTFTVRTCATSVTNQAYRVVTSTQGVTSGLGTPVTTTQTLPTVNASFTSVPAAGYAGQPVTFSSTSTTNGSPLNRWEWTLGDGTTASGPVIQHLYAAAGTYTVTLKVTDGCGYTATHSVALAVNVPPLVLTKNAAPEPVAPGERLTYTVTALNGGAQTLTNLVISDTLPANIQLVTGSLALTPAGAGTLGTVPPVLASGVTISVGQRITLTYAVTVTAGFRLTNTVVVTSTQIPTPTFAIITSTVSDLPPVAAADSGLLLEDTSVVLAVLANDYDPNGNPVSLGAVGAPAHGSAVQQGSSVQYTPAADFYGTDTFTYTVSDGGLTADAAVTVVVTGVNDVPVFVKGPDQTVDEDAGPQRVGGWVTGISAGPNEAGQTLAFTVVNDNPALFTAQPDVAADGTLAYTPAADLSGQAVVTVTLHDDSGTANGGVDTSAPQTFVITVDPVNDPPTLDAPAALTITEDAGPQVVVLAGIGTGAADEVQALVVTATSANPTLIPHPTVAYTSPEATGSLTLTPLPDQSGTATIAVTVTDGLSATVRTFTVTVTAVNDAPVISAVADQVTAEDTPVGPVAFTVGDGETPAGDLTVTAASSNPALLPVSGIALGGSGAERTVTLTPAANAFGTAVVTLTVSDGELSAATAFTLTVTAVNDAPVISAVADQVTAEDTPVGPVAFTVGDGETPAGDLTVTAASSNPALLPVSGIALGGSGAERTVTLTPAANAFGTAVVTLTVSDGELSAATAFTLTVTAANDAPVIAAVADQTTTEDTPVGPVAFTVGDVETPAGDLTVTAASSNPALLPVSGIALGGSGAERTVTLIPAANAFGTAVVTLTVSDGELSAATAFTLTVTAVNDAPVIAAVADQTTTEDTPVGPVAFTVGDVETPAGDLTVTAASSNPALLPVSGIALGGSGAERTVTLIPAANAFGTAVVTLTVSDGELSAATAFTLTVTAVNDAPVIAAVADQVTAEDTPVGPVAFTVGDVETPAGDLTVTAASSNPALLPVSGIALGGSGVERTVTLTPAANAFGTAVVTLTVSDGDQRAVTAFTVTVTAVNDAPALTAVADQVTAEDTPVGPLAFTVGDVETPADDLTVTAASSNLALLPVSNIALGGSGAERTVTLTPAPDAFGTAVVTLIVSDGDLSAQTAFTVTVTPVNHAPTDLNLNNSSVAENAAVGTVVGTFSTVDPDAGNTYTYTLVSGAGSDDNSLFAVAGQTLQTAVVFNFEVCAVYHIRVRTTDQGGLTYESPFTVTVTNVNEAPVFTSVPVTAALQGTAYSYTITGTDVDAGDTLVVAASTLPGWLALTVTGNGTALLTGTPGAAEVGVHAIVLQLSDAGGLTAMQSFSITVSPVMVNQPPAFTSQPGVNAVQGTLYTYAVTTTDPDAGDALTITALTRPAWLTLSDHHDRTATLNGTPGAGDVGQHPVVLQVSDPAGATATQAFTITVTALFVPLPNTPVLQWPANGTITTTKMLTLTWQPAPLGGTPSGYNLQLDGVVITTTQPFAAAVLAVGVHTWTARSYNEVGYSDWATPWTFEVKADRYFIYLPLTLRNQP